MADKKVIAVVGATGGNMFPVYRDFEKEILGARSIDVARSLNLSLQTFDQWLAKHKSKIPLA